MTRPVLLAIVTAALLAGAVLAWNTVREEREFRALVAAGDTALAQDQTYAAIEAFSGALALKDDSMVAHLKRGDAYRRRGELTAALRDLREAASLDPTAPRPAELLGDVNAAMGRYDRAAEHYRRFIALDDREPHVHYKLGVALYRAGRAHQALEPLRRAVALDERMAEAHHLLGVCLRETRSPRESRRALERALELNPALAAAREELAELHGAAGRTRNRIEQLEALAALEPARASRLVSVGVAYAAAGRTDAAVTTLGRAAERYPDDPLVYSALGRVWLDAAEERSDRVALSKALEALQPAAARVTATSETLTLYGRALFLSGEIDASELVLQQAVARSPIDSRAYLYLAEAADRLRHAETARIARARHEALR